jgi:zinc transporter, ZIP family
MLNLGTLLGLFVVSGLSTLLGSVPVLFHRYLRDSSWSWLEGFGGGVMTGASLFSLFWPATLLLQEQQRSLWIMAQATLLGVGFVFIASFALGRLIANSKKHHAFLIVFVMALHNIPEGIAVGVNVAALGWSKALPLNAAIFIQNLPEGFVSSMSFLLAGYGIYPALLANALTAVCEVLAAILGYILARGADHHLAFMLAFAGASMLSVVVMEYGRQRRRGEAHAYSWSGFLTGLVLTAVLDLLL